MIMGGGQGSINPKPAPQDGNRVWEVTTPPTQEPVTKDELKMFGRLDGNHEDELLQSFIISARIAVEKFIGLALMAQTITVRYDYWPGVYTFPYVGAYRANYPQYFEGYGRGVPFPIAPVSSVTSIATVDEDGAETAYDADNYYVDLTGNNPVITIKFGTTPPTNTVRDSRGIKMVYIAGYGTRAQVPEPLKEAIKLWAMFIYENRTTGAKPPAAARGLLDMYKVYKI